MGWVYDIGLYILRCSFVTFFLNLEKPLKINYITNVTKVLCFLVVSSGYVAVTSEWSRLFFMVFYLVMLVVMSVVVAFILEAFTFRIEYNHTVLEDVDGGECCPLILLSFLDHTSLEHQCTITWRSSNQ